MTKAIVRYTPSEHDIIIRGKPAWVKPIDHTSPYVSNTQNVVTSKVLSIKKNGVFETLNSIYVPEGVDYEIYR